MSYHAPSWLRGGHAQTIWPAVAIREPAPPYHRSHWTTPDGGQIAVDTVAGQPGAPLVLLFHGLEGSSDSHYARALANAALARGWWCVVPHFRGCGGEANTTRRAYHAGDSEEVRWICERLAIRHPLLFAAGVSLGGNMLLKYLGEAGDDTPVHTAAAISAPLDLAAASTRLDVGLGRHVYTRMFLSTLKPKALGQWQAHPDLFDVRSLRQARTFREFDQIVTAPLHGFAGAEDYWERASSKPYLQTIARPTLVLNAVNDPFLPPSALPTPADVSPAVTLEQPAEGGHVGFVTGRFPGRIDWLPQRLLSFFDHSLSAGAARSVPKETCNVRHS